MQSSGEHFVEGMQKELAHRKRELTAVKLQIGGEVLESGGEQQWVLRAAVALSYAHWEGFVMSAGRRYLKLVSSLNLSTSDLKPGLQALAVLSHFKQASPSTKTRFLAEVLVSMDDRRAQTFRVNPDKAFDTEGNLSSIVMADLLSCLGLDKSLFDNQAGFIDQKIVYSRHKVAHGELVEFSRNEALERLEGVVRLLDEFLDVLIEAIQDEHYLLTGPHKE